MADSVLLAASVVMWSLFPTFWDGSPTVLYYRGQQMMTPQYHICALRYSKTALWKLGGRVANLRGQLPSEIKIEVGTISVLNPVVTSTNGLILHDQNLAFFLLLFSLKRWWRHQLHHFLQCHQHFCNNTCTPPVPWLVAHQPSINFQPWHYSMWKYNQMSRYHWGLRFHT